MSSLFIGFLLTPMVLKVIGDERMGGYRTLVDCFGNLGLLEFGIFGSLIARFSYAIGSQNLPLQRYYLFRGTRITMGTVLISLVGSLGIYLFLPQLIPLSPAVFPELKLGFFIMLISLLSLLFWPLRAFCEAAQEGYVASIAQWVQNLTINLLTLLFVFQGRGIVGQCLAFVIGNLLFGILLGRAVKKRHPEVFRGLLRSDGIPTDAKPLWNLQRDNFIYNLAGRISLATDNIVISVILGPARVAPVIFSQQLFAVISSQLQGVGTATWPAMAEIHAKGEYELYRKNFFTLCKLVAFLAGGALVPIYVFNESFIQLWLGATRYAGSLFNIAIALNSFFLPVLTIWSWAMTSTGKVGKLVLPTVIQAGINFSLSIFFTYRLGPAGPVWGSLVSYIVVPLIWFPILLKREFKIEPGPLCLAFLPSLMLAGLSAVLLKSITEFQRASHWPELLLKLSLTGVGYLLFAYLVLLSREEKRDYAQKAKFILENKLKIRL